MRRFLRIVLFTYFVGTVVAGVILTELTVRPPHRPILEKVEAVAVSVRHHAPLRDVEITSAEGVPLRAWVMKPNGGHSDAVMLLHGIADNRVGMLGYAEIFLSRGYTVLLPDARAHGSSAGDLATYGIRERQDISRWMDWLVANEKPGCVYGFGESIGGAMLLQALGDEKRFCAAIAESPFSNFYEAAFDRMGANRSRIRRGLVWPTVQVGLTYALLRYHLDLTQAAPDRTVAAVRVPMLLIHGADDTNIPLRHSTALQKINPRYTQLWEVKGAQHCGAHGAARAEFESRVAAWFRRGV